MSKPLLPPGIYEFRLQSAQRSKNSILMIQCIFEPINDFKGYQTVSRTISKHSPWADSSRPFIDQLEGFNHDSDFISEVQRYLGQEFTCKVKEGKGWQRNITVFLDRPVNINSRTHVNNGIVTGQSQVEHV